MSTLPSPGPTDRPWWLLDFDDVLNACVKDPSKSPDRNAWHDWQRTEADCPPEGETEDKTFPIWYSPTVVATVADALAAGVHVVWLSTWERHTSRLPAAIPGLPDLPYLPRPEQAFGVERPRKRAEHEMAWWKYHVAKASVPDTVPLLWTDDDLHGHGLAAEWARSRPAPSLLIAPPLRIGLTQKRLREIREFLRLDAEDDA